MRALVALLIPGCALLAAAGCGGADPPPPTESPGPAVTVPGYVGGATCAGCHDEQYRRWQGSHHDLALQAADETTVLGDFDAARFEHGGVTSEFYRGDGGFYVRTDGPDGEPAEFEVTHTFGVDPLQQYLVPRPGGRLQALHVAWDSRPAGQGGQRWFHLYPGEAIGHGDPLHWTGPFMNWNSSCAGCHSTDLRKRYSAAGDSYDTGYASIDVDCEACHGPGSLHSVNPRAGTPGLDRGAEAHWTFPPGAAIAVRSAPRETDTEIETCAQCHSRRSQLADEFRAGAALLDAFRPSLLEPGLYHADGQILDEVYVYGSFLQSRMYAAGVTCSDCHDPHSAGLRADGNAVCAGCHLPAVYDAADHHRHQPGAPGAQCVDCHMPARTYMVVDPRRDHSFRVPRPDLTATLGTPNACVACHEERGSSWAASQVDAWFPDGRGGRPHYGEALAAGRGWDRDRTPRLHALIADPGAPAIVRATAIGQLAEQPDGAALRAFATALGDTSPLVRLAAVDAQAAAPAGPRIAALRPFLADPLLAIRLAAARALAPLRAELPQAQREALDAALDEYRQSQAFNSDRAEGWLNLAGLEADLGDVATAIATLESAVDRHPYFVAAYVNLADLYRREGREPEALALLQEAIAQTPDDAAGHFALGLALVRAGAGADALAHFRRAVELDPDSPYYRYVLGVALNSLADTAEALASLRAANERFPGYRDIVFLLATMHRDAGDSATALRYARELLALDPGDPQARALAGALEADGSR